MVAAVHVGENKTRRSLTKDMNEENFFELQNKDLKYLCLISLSAMTRNVFFFCVNILLIISTNQFRQRLDKIDQ